LGLSSMQLPTLPLHEHYEVGHSRCALRVGS
jgi:hypothetical protein